MFAGLEPDEQLEGDEGGSVDYTASYPQDDDENLDSAVDDAVKDGMSVTGGGIIVGVKKIIKTSTMAILTIEDTFGTFDCMVFAKTYERYRDLIEEDKMVTIRGRVSIREGKSPVVVVDTIIPWENKKVELVKNEKKVYLRFDTKNIDVYNTVKRIAATYPGESSVIVRCASTNQVFGFSAKVDPNNYLVNELIGLLGEENVVVK